MSNNKKEQAAYDYLHNNKPVKGNLLQSILHKWKRWNNDWGEFRKEKKDKIDRQLNKDMYEEL